MVSLACKKKCSLISLALKYLVNGFEGKNCVCRQVPESIDLVFMVSLYSGFGYEKENNPATLARNLI